jgi:hypothetical protein
MTKRGKFAYNESAENEFAERGGSPRFMEKIQVRTSIARFLSPVSVITSVLLLATGDYLPPFQSRSLFVEYLFESISAFGILEKAGATEVVIPEREMAAKIARSLISPNVLEYIPLTREYPICEVAPPASFVGKSIAEIQLRKRYNIGLLASRDVLTDQISMIPGGDCLVKDSDILVVIGKEKDIQDLK